MSRTCQLRKTKNTITFTRFHDWHNIRDSYLSLHPAALTANNCELSMLRKESRNVLFHKVSFAFCFTITNGGTDQQSRRASKLCLLNLPEKGLSKVDTTKMTFKA